MSITHPTNLTQNTRNIYDTPQLFHLGSTSSTTEQQFWSTFLHIYISKKCKGVMVAVGHVFIWALWSSLPFMIPSMHHIHLSWGVNTEEPFYQDTVLSCFKIKHIKKVDMCICVYIYRVSKEECARLREGVPYAKLYQYNPKHLSPKLNGYGDNGQRKVWSSCGSTHCTCQLTISSMSALECGVI